MADTDVDRVLAATEDEILELDETRDESEKVETPCKFTTGIAGSGKTFSVRKAIDEDPKAALLCATTGIAAVNLGTITLHSALGLHPDAIDDQFTSGYMRDRMHRIARSHRSLGIDEMSMLSATLLDMLHTTAEQVNEFKDVRHGFGLHLIGDFCQLPPIKEPWCFTAECWPKFEANTVKLTKNWRQGDGPFLDALNCLRRGDGGGGARGLADCAHFVRNLDPNFDGTVILGRNAEVDNYNQLRYWRLKGHEFIYPATRWGKQRSEWKNIPDILKVKVGAYVMILANDTEKDVLTREPLFRWVNGDCGHVVNISDDPDYPCMGIELVRTGKTVDIDMVSREFKQKHAPDNLTEAQVKDLKETPRKRHTDGTYYEQGYWHLGAVTYMPLRLAYATTVHKSQGLSLDRVMIDMRHNFLGSPAMLYVACSRARTAEGLYLVGDRAMAERRCNIDEAVRRWL